TGTGTPGGTGTGSPGGTGTGSPGGTGTGSPGGTGTGSPGGTGTGSPGGTGTGAASTGVARAIAATSKAIPADHLTMVFLLIILLTPSCTLCLNNRLSELLTQIVKDKLSFWFNNFLA
ncbi:MAG: hypothetical protein ACREP9_18610, partial [Candidatus Dormibacteraceae bacterium]